MKIGVFVDLISLFGSIKASYDGRKIDYKKYLEIIENEGEIYRAYAYGAFVNDEANGFINCLQSIGFETKYVKAIYFDDKPDIKKTDRTMDMIVDVLRIIDRIDTVVIGTLNVKMIPFILYLKERGIKTILFSCNVKKELRNSFDLYYHINESILEPYFEEVLE